MEVPSNPEFHVPIPAALPVLTCISTSIFYSLRSFFTIYVRWNDLFILNSSLAGEGQIFVYLRPYFKIRSYTEWNFSNLSILLKLTKRETYRVSFHS